MYQQLKIYFNLKIHRGDERADILQFQEKSMFKNESYTMFIILTFI